LSRGANFAIIGDTSLDVGFFLRRNAASVPPFRSSLRVQIGWFRRLKRSLCNTTTAAAAAGCKDRLMARSLFVVGELGSNDYGYILAGGKGLPEAKSFVPEVVKAICRGIEVSIFSFAIDPVPQLYVTRHTVNSLRGRARRGWWKRERDTWWCRGRCRRGACRWR